MDQKAVPAIAGQDKVEKYIDHGSQDGAAFGAHTSDHRGQQNRHGPAHIESPGRLDESLVNVVNRPGQTCNHGTDNKRVEFQPECIDAAARCRPLVVPDGSQAQSQVGIQYQAEDNDRNDGDGQCHPVNFVDADTGYFFNHISGTAASHRPAHRPPENEYAAQCFGNHQGSDGEINAAEPKHGKSNEYGEYAGHNSAADQAGGLRYGIDKGDYSKSLHPGFAAMQGVMLALLVLKGANGPKGILEYPTGFCHALSEQPDIEKIVDGLGKPYEITTNSLKAYPTILISHSSIQAILAMMNEHDIECSQIMKVHLTISSTAKGQGQNYDPETPLAARLSIPFSVALALIDKEVSLKQFTRERLDDPQIKDMMARIEIEADPSLNAKYPETLASIAVLETKTKGLKNQVIYPKGNMKNPMTKDDVVAKYRALCAGAMDRNKSEQILQRLFDLDQTDALQELFDLLRG